MKAASLLFALTLGAANGALAQAGAEAGITSEVPAPAQSLKDNPRVRASVLKLVGYARGSYTDGDGLVIAQLLESMRSRHDITRTVFPDGRKVFASINPEAHGRERAALLLDGKDNLLAAGLVNGHCRPRKGDDAKVCNPEPQTVLTVFQPAGAKEADAAPLLAWSKKLPGMLALAAESDDPEEVAAAQKIASVEYVTAPLDVAGWSKAEVPRGFPASLAPLLVATAEIRSTASAGKVVLPKGLAGLPMYTQYQAAQQQGEKWPDAQVILLSYADFDSVVDQYRGLAKGARFEESERKATFDGADGAGRYRVLVEDRRGSDGVFVTVSSWRRAK
ncbi:hypothetical protein [Janthinobacterium fluminis]|uniref:Uncharacterized protein n=1 Tax=Janthinobacterium fluminis TaxID=2987524 RepID=A0ABT5K300_9BURK|nr:hypothetical protein [Janthinobacterium fluminis]MDC8759060.1 hypothetical protein [Janthinobacterium fluminis]